ncbi:MAG: glycosyl transferase [Burkholderiales bacterium]|nr:glycosyl transferase [Burkholderiales bacterium]
MSAAIIALGVSLTLMAFVLRWPAHVPHDRPNERSLHDRPVPRAGGWAIVGAYLAAAAVGGAPPGFDDDAQRALLLAVVVLFAVSLIDDVRGLSPLLRILAQAGCALVLARALGAQSGPLAFAALVVALVASANFYNFMDGSDGLAGAMALVGFGAYAAAAHANGATAAPAAALAVAAGPFLAANWPPARVFLGDAGSVPLGFLAAALGAGGAAAGVWGPWFPVLVFLPFVADATVTLATRLLRGERVWKAHRDHYYQRLVRLGAGHRGTLALYGALMVGCASTAVACAVGLPAAGPWALGAWCAIIALVFAAIDYHWGRRPTS